ncbi:sulfatase-like hydrolase/transferase [bacterium]|nr:sulfatase-like hydrolase/transferase [bacterium]
MKKFTLFGLGFLLLSNLGFSAPADESRSASSDKPNIVVIMADDLGYADLGCYGCKDIPTPHLDQLAADGARFTSAYVTWPMCGPSRAGFLTGRNQSTFGYYKNPSLPFDPEQGLPKIETIASLLQKQGYVTGGVGKWHMGTSNDQHPNAMGFDDWFGFLSGGLMYFPLDHPNYKGRFTSLKRPAKWRDIHHTLPVIHNQKPVEWDQYLTRELTDAGTTFMEKNKEEPFFLFMSYNAPHLDLEAPEETIAKFPAEKMTQVPGVTPKDRSVYGAMVSELDQGVGQLLTKLDQLKLSENTIVWFLSDNGGMKRTSDNRPLKGAKGNAYEGGLRVPMIVKWPNRIPSGLELTNPVTSLDIGATSIAMAGGSPEQSGLHGKDIRPYLTQQSKEAPHEILYWHTAKGRSPGGVVRKGPFKLLIKSKGKPELYHLENDLSESNNLAPSNPDHVQRMLVLWNEWDKHNKPDLWGKPKKPYQFADYEWLKGTQHYRTNSK